MKKGRSGVTDFWLWMYLMSSSARESLSVLCPSRPLAASLNLIRSVHRCLGCNRHNQLIGPRSHGVLRAFRNRINANMKNLSMRTSRANLSDVTGEPDFCSIRNFQPSLTTRRLLFGSRRQLGRWLRKRHLWIGATLYIGLQMFLNCSPNQGAICSTL